MAAQIGVKQIGQVERTIVAAPESALGRYPEGNTGHARAA